jgi:hypothetical protein
MQRPQIFEKEMIRPTEELAVVCSMVHLRMNGVTPGQTPDETKATVQSFEFRRLCEDLVFEMSEQHKGMEGIVGVLRKLKDDLPLAPFGFMQALGVAAGVNTPRQEKWLMLAYNFATAFADEGIDPFTSVLQYAFQSSIPEKNLPLFEGPSPEIFKAIELLGKERDFTEIARALSKMNEMHPSKKAPLSGNALSNKPGDEPTL